MNKILALFLCSILLLSCSGCNNKVKMDTSISNSTVHFVQDNLIQIDKLPWKISSDKARNILGEINEEYLSSYDSQIKLMPNEQLEFTDLELTSEFRIHYFDENDQLYSVCYAFAFTDREQATQKWRDVVEYFKENLPSSFEYHYNENTGSTLLDLVELDVFEIPMAKWLDDTGAELRITVELDVDAFILYIKLGSNQGHNVI